MRVPRRDSTFRQGRSAASFQPIHNLIQKKINAATHHQTNTHTDKYINCSSPQARLRRLSWFRILDPNHSLLCRYCCFNFDFFNGEALARNVVFIARAQSNCRDETKIHSIVYKYKKFWEHAREHWTFGKRRHTFYTHQLGKEQNLAEYSNF